MDTRSKAIGWTVGIAIFVIFVFILSNSPYPPDSLTALFIFAVSGGVGYLAAMFAWEGKGPGRVE